MKSDTAPASQAGSPSSHSVLWLLVASGVGLLPLAAHIAGWLCGFVLLALLWRAGAETFHWRIPSRAFRIGCGVGMMASVYATYGRIYGLAAGGTLLALLMCLKLTEICSARDLRVGAILLYIVLLATLLYSQSLWTLPYLLVIVWWVTALLVESSHPATALPLSVSLRWAGLGMGQALPFVVVLFFLFPRLPGPLWSLPSSRPSAQTGLSESMTPGSIRHLVLNNTEAFQVRFNGAVPPRDKRYWRGPVLDHFDGRTWTAGPAPDKVQVKISTGSTVHYQITLRPGHEHWVLALDLPDPRMLPPDTQISGNAVLSTLGDISRVQRYDLTSEFDYVLAPDLSPEQRAANLELPRQGNPKARALAQSWVSQGWTPDQIIQAALQRYRTEKFRYDLNPPPVGRNAVDDFLFQTHAGFCEQFAGSFTFLMRAAGIPARIVTGYQGGKRNPFGDFYIVRESDAHAWSEVWLEQRGWVRIDPTAAVAPARITQGIAAALMGDVGLPDFLSRDWTGTWEYAFQARWDWLNHSWNHFIAGYTALGQTRFLQKLGLQGFGKLLATALLGALLALGAVYLSLRPRRVKAHPDDALRQWRRATHRLQREGFEQAPNEGAVHFTLRVVQARPEYGDLLTPLSEAYVALRYGEPGDTRQRQLLRRMGRLTRRLARRVRFFRLRIAGRGSDHVDLM